MPDSILVFQLIFPTTCLFAFPSERWRAQAEGEKAGCHRKTDFCIWAIILLVMEQPALPFV